jgi:hypothetical protein
MKNEPSFMSSAQNTPEPQQGRGTTAGHSGTWLPSRRQISQNRHTIYRALWYLVNASLVIAMVFAIYSIGWEYSTRRYLKGFSDAIVPATSPPEEKIEAILNWMAHGPTRLGNGPSGLVPDRDPTDTLNYEALLKVCGTATNAFINLVDSGGLEARRLLLVDENRMTKHVVAEVWVDGRWIVADPSFRVLYRSANGKALTREALADPATFATATENVPKYDPSYTFDRTTHVRLARLKFVGSPLRSVLDRVFPGWEDSMTMTLLVERESFAATVIGIFFVLFLILIRVFLRWYGEHRLGVNPFRIRDQFRRAAHAFVDTAS